MLHHWAITIPKSEASAAKIKGTIEGGLGSILPFRPHDVVCHELNDGAILLSLSANWASFGYSEPPVKYDEHRVLSISGLPVLEGFDVDARGDILAVVQRELETGDFKSLFKRISGCWSLGFYADSRLICLSSFSGYYTCYYASSEHATISIGTRPSLVQLASGIPHSLDSLGLLMLPTKGMLVGDLTCFQSVRKIPLHRALVHDSQGPIRLAELFSEEQVPSEDLIESGVQRLGRRLGWYFDRGLELKSHLTGGKDSRAVVALAKATGRATSLAQIETHGSPESGDVRVSKLVANALGLTDKHHTRVSSKRADWSDDELLEKFAFGALKYDGALTAFDGAMRASPRPPKVATLTGGGAEVYREPHLATNDLSPDRLSQILANWHSPFDPLRILDLEAQETVRDYFSSAAQTSWDTSIVNLGPRLYLDHRLSTWGTGHFQNATSPSLAMLLDVDLYQAVVSNRLDPDWIHFSILKRLAPDALKVPLLNNKWRGRAGEECLRLGIRPRAIKVEEKKDFPWQFRLAESSWRSIAKACEKHAEALPSVFSRPAIRRLSRSELARDALKPGIIKSLFGLVLALLLVTRQRPRSIDFQNSDVRAIRGSLSACVQDGAAAPVHGGDTEFERDLRGALQLTAPRELTRGWLDRLKPW